MSAFVRGRWDSLLRGLRFQLWHRHRSVGRMQPARSIVPARRVLICPILSAPRKTSGPSSDVAAAFGRIWQGMGQWPIPFFYFSWLRSSPLCTIRVFFGAALPSAMTSAHSMFAWRAFFVQPPSSGFDVAAIQNVPSKFQRIPPLSSPRR